MIIRWLTATCVVLACGLAAAQQPRAGTGRVAASMGFWQPPDRLPHEAPQSTAPPPVAPPAEDQSITLVELESIALGNNPTLVQAAMRVRALEHKWVQAGLYPNPVVGYSAEEMNDEGTAGKQGAFVGQEVVTAGKLRLQQAAISQEVAQARSGLDAQRQRVLTDVRSGYYEVILAQRTVELDEQLVGIGAAAVKSTEDLLAAQEVSQVDVLQARIEADSARLKLEDARNRHQAAWRRLASVLGTPQMVAPRLIGDVEGELPELTWSESVTRLLTESPELKRARAGVCRARWAIQREEAQVVPNVELQASVHHDNAGRQTIAGVEVGLPIPIFDRNQGNIARARAELVVASSEVRRLELQLHERLAVAFEQYENARQQVQRYRTSILPNAQKSLDLVQLGYRQGEFGYLTMLTAQRTFFTANLNYLESLRELWIASSRVEGLLLEGSLEGSGGGD